MAGKVQKRMGESARSGNGAGASATVPDSRFDRRLAEILDAAAEIFFDKGYEGASMRDLSRQSGMSLSGLYHYFESKEKLLYLIQRHTFLTILDRLRERLAGNTNPEEGLRIFIRNHLEYFIANMKAMKVLSHEAGMLKGPYGQEIQTIKRQYYRICVDLLESLRKARLGKNAPPPVRHQHRTEVLALFGMVNWIYTWYNPQIDPPGAELAEQMAEIYLRGVLGEGTQRKLRKGRTAFTES
jgi:AcrR family transcriptional regulator